MLRKNFTIVPKALPMRLPVSIGLLLLCATAVGRRGDLQTCLRKPDNAFAWRQLDQKEQAGFTVTHLELISQQWREGAWPHHMQVVRPEKVRNPGIAFLFITGDGDGQKNLALLKDRKSV